MGKVELEGELFILVEETGDEGVSVCAEISGINIWNWLKHKDGQKVKVTLEDKFENLLPTR